MRKLLIEQNGQVLAFANVNIFYINIYLGMSPIFGGRGFRQAQPSCHSFAERKQCKLIMSEVCKEIIGINTYPSFSWNKLHSFRTKICKKNSKILNNF